MLLVLASSLTLAAPPIPPAAKWTPPAIQVRTLASGAKLWVIPQKGIPLVHVGVHIDSGSVADPADKPGLASLTATCVEEGGSGTRSGAEVRSFFDSLGTQLDFKLNPDSVSITFSTLTAQLEPALGQLIDVLGKPRFDPNTVTAVKQRLSSEVVAALDEPSEFGRSKLLAEIYGAHPRNHLEQGSVAGLESATADDIKQFHAAHWSPSDTIFIMVGDIEPDAAKAMLDKAAPKAWLPASVKKPLAVPAAAPAKWLAFDKPGAAQTVVMFGRPGPASSDPALVPLELSATLLGGSFTSRLVQNLREKHGYTYGAASILDWGRETKQILVFTSVKTEVTAPALTELVSELTNITHLEASELDKARSLLDSRQLQSFSSGESAVEALLELAREDLGPQSLAQARDRRAKVTLAELTTAAGNFDPERFTVVLVGDRAKLEKDLKAKFPARNIEWR